MRSALSPPVARWLRYEQTVNDKIWNERFFTPVDALCPVAEAYRPESQRAWPLEAVFVPDEHVRSYGFAGKALSAHLGIEAPARTHAILVHPQSHGTFRSAI